MLTLASTLVSCGTSIGAPSSDEPPGEMPRAISPSTDGDASPKGGAPTDARDAGLPGLVDAGRPASRAKCGASDYQWVGPSTMGTIFEQVNRANHTQLELNYAIVKARNDGAFKTRRLATHATKTSLLRYQTQDRGAPVDATTLVTYPDSSGTFPILLILHGTSGFSDACAPTRGIADEQFGGFANELGLLSSLFASFGYVVVFPDYIGMKSLGAPSPALHPYLVGEPTAIASLDAVRATKKLLATNRAIPGQLVVMGGSQGGHAAAFVSRFQPHYAPELPIKGSVWDVPPSDLLAHTEAALASKIKATLNSAAFFSAAEEWYRASSTGLAGAFVAPYDVGIPTDMRTKCSFDAPPGPLESLFTPTLLASARQPGLGNLAPWACYVRENGLPTTSIPKLDSVPTLFLLGENDDLVSPTIERASFRKLCGQGHVLQYLECSGATHTKPLTYAFDQWLDFLDARLRGDPMPPDTCAVRPAERCTSQP